MQTGIVLLMQVLITLVYSEIFLPKLSNSAKKLRQKRSPNNPYQFHQFYVPSLQVIPINFHQGHVWHHPPMYSNSNHSQILVPFHELVPVHELIPVSQLSVIPLQRMREQKVYSVYEDNKFRTPIGGFGVGWRYGGHGAGHGFHYGFG
ncbi:unnamed protein product [Leptidea sinapis]|uniref:Uncharacterized protein n=1 Tax=Leptidea sinapis TaxID=189913 RepID=A0A5E4QJ09_9NEOP|nr:unnamed protein product [Leptidea sinapis]